MLDVKKKAGFLYQSVINYVSHLKLYTESCTHKKCLGKETPHVKVDSIWNKILQNKGKEKKIYSITVLRLRTDSIFKSLE